MCVSVRVCVCECVFKVQGVCVCVCVCVCVRECVGGLCMRKFTGMTAMLAGQCVVCVWKGDGLYVLNN